MKQPVVVKPLDLVVDAARLGEQGFSAQSEDPTRLVATRPAPCCRDASCTRSWSDRARGTDTRHSYATTSCFRLQRATHQPGRGKSRVRTAATMTQNDERRLLLNRASGRSGEQ